MSVPDLYSSSLNLTNETASTDQSVISRQAGYYSLYTVSAGLFFLAISMLAVVWRRLSRRRRKKRLTNKFGQFEDIAKAATPTPDRGSPNASNKSRSVSVDDPPISETIC